MVQSLMLILVFFLLVFACIAIYTMMVYFFSFIVIMRSFLPVKEKKKKLYIFGSLTWGGFLPGNAFESLG